MLAASDRRTTKPVVLQTSVATGGLPVRCSTCRRHTGAGGDAQSRTPPPERSDRVQGKRPHRRTPVPGGRPMGAETTYFEIPNSLRAVPTSATGRPMDLAYSATFATSGALP